MYAALFIIANGFVEAKRLETGRHSGTPSGIRTRDLHLERVMS